MLKYSLVATCLAMVAQHGFAANDIAGIKPGISLAAERVLITKVNPKYTLTDIKLTSGKIAGLQAVAEVNGKPVDHMVVLSDEAGIVWFVGRTQAFDQGARLTKDNLTKSLVEKYGPVSVVNVMSNEWEFDRDGKLFKKQNGAEPCPAFMGNLSTTFNKIPGTAISAPQNFQATCGMRITSLVREDPDSMISAFTVTIVDVKRMYDQLNGNALDAATKRQKALDAEKAKNVKPSL